MTLWVKLMDEFAVETSSHLSVGLEVHSNPCSTHEEELPRLFDGIT